MSPPPPPPRPHPHPPRSLLLLAHPPQQFLQLRPQILQTGVRMWRQRKRARETGRGCPGAAHESLVRGICEFVTWAGRRGAGALTRHTCRSWYVSVRDSLTAHLGLDTSRDNKAPLPPLHLDSLVRGMCEFVTRAGRRGADTSRDDKAPLPPLHLDASKKEEKRRGGG